MNTIIEEELDFNSLEDNSNWQTGMDFNSAPQVFAVTNIPEGPIIDVNALASKPTVISDVQPEGKDTVPAIKAAPVTKRVEQQYLCDDSVEMDESDPAFALFADTPIKELEPAYQVFGSISFEKATETFELNSHEEGDSTSKNDVVSSSTMARFERLCSNLDSLSSRLESFVPM